MQESKEGLEQRSNSSKDLQVPKARKESVWNRLKKSFRNAFIQARNWFRRRPRSSSKSMKSKEAEREQTLSQKALAKRLPLVEVGTIKLNPAHNVEVINRQIGNLYKEEQKIERELEHVISILAEMQRLHQNTIQEEEKIKQKMKDAYVVRDNLLRLKIIEAEEEKKKLENEWLTERQTIIDEKTVDIKKCEALSSGLKRLEFEIKNLKEETNKESDNYKMEIEKFEEQVKKRRKNDFHDLHKYKEMKNKLEEMLKERRVVRQALEELKSEDTFAESKNLSLTSERCSSHLSDSDKVMNDLDYKKNMRDAVTQINQLNGFKEIANEESINDIEGYAVTGSVVGKTDYSLIYTTKCHTFGNEHQELYTKIIDLNELNDLVQKNFKQTTSKIIRFLIKNPFRNIVEIHDIFLVANRKIFIIEEPLKRDLNEILKNDGPFNERMIRSIAETVANAINYLHNIGIAHQNINPSNVYKNANGVLKLTDFEYATIYWDAEKDEIKLEKEQRNRKGIFVAPEITRGYEHDPTKVDIYSFGMLLSFMAIETFSSENSEFLSKQFHSANILMHKNFSEIAQNLINECIFIDPQKRPNIRDIVVHPWFADSL
ncbi:testis-specific serine/threonine-protein kinase 3-like protein [Dinothrombium tinctorium]|uniref:Testis-specific serine/threonine-protein kinase 3-like protein n=1 Tax=Dinothrombium tinctorium TaxID=1965070 RepID=A0A3S3NYM6_9ACAR|nr:testis-specific serine/threonine-protein kinase 3-like protein [Dinothrombium tinctorium]RWS08483.1 testis-specific serine/threonine-protein kinase 3-like protein [Dinothrombium tinctorium]RWS13821.1 testis-specific serine/threonine-protein kinase 3-like protein [Dinothrombium tinctorium]